MSSANVDDGRGEIVWQPAADAWQRSRLSQFAAMAGSSGFAASSTAYRSYDELLEWSLQDPGGFWGAFSCWAGVRWHDTPTRAMGSTSMPGTEWFPGGTLNYAEHALAGSAAGAPAIIALSQSRTRSELTGDDLAQQVARCQDGLRRLGVQRGDRVAAYLPNIPETIITFLASAALGAIFTSCAPEFGVRAVTDRWSQLEPTVVVAVGGYQYGTRRIERRDELREIIAALPSVRHVVVVAYLDAADGPDIALDRHVLSWAELLGDRSAREATIEPVPFDHPLYVLFSSGTTGLPKPIVHGHGGVIVEHLKVLSLHHDLGPGDRFMWFTTTGWMMWNYLVSGLLVGSTIVLFDGDPASPDLSTLWRIAADERLHVFGVSAPFIMACRKAAIDPGTTFDLHELRQLGSTGAPLPRDGYRWVRDAIGSHVQPCSLSGGTDVCTAFVGPAPTEPVRAGEISVRMLGCDVQAVDASGERCPDGITGELVIASPMPSMPVGLWADPTGRRYCDTYFEAFPGRWHHGDWITFQDGSCEITGRSDATLNRGGVRLGTSDFYAVVESMPEIVDSLVVHLEDTDGGPGALILLVACSPGHHLDDTLRSRIGTALRTQLSPRHVPDLIDQLPAIPRTLSGKKLEVPVKRLLLGYPVSQVASRGSLADPTALDVVVDWAARYQENR